MISPLSVTPINKVPPSSVNLHTLIRQGEGPLLEFKSSFRWDLEQDRVNRALETVVLREIEFFLVFRLLMRF
jgi:hypothetical protein